MASDAENDEMMIDLLNQKENSPPCASTSICKTCQVTAPSVKILTQVAVNMILNEKTGNMQIIPVEEVETEPIIVNQVNFQDEKTETNKWKINNNSINHPVSPSVLDTPEYPNSILDSPVAQIPTIPQAAVSPEMIRPFPKAPPRKESGRGRKKGKSRILTDTPEKNEIEAAYLQRVARTRAKTPTLKRKKVTNEKKYKKSSKRMTKKTNLFEESDETDSEMHLDSEDETSTNFVDTENTDNEDVEINDAEISTPVKVGDFVLVQFPTVRKQNNLNFVGKIEKIDGSGLTVNFFKKKGLVAPKFYYPEKQDKSFVSVTDVLTKLPQPDVAPGTSRTMSMFTFKFDFSTFKLG